MTPETTTPILLRAANGNIYQYDGECDGGHRLTNLSTGKVGVVSAETAKKVLKLPVDVNFLIDKNPILISFIKKLKLGLE